MYENWIRNPIRRYQAVTFLTCVLVFLGCWTLALPLWIANAWMGYREAGDSKFRYVHAAVAAVLAVLLAVNLWAWGTALWGFLGWG